MEYVNILNNLNVSEIRKYAEHMDIEYKNKTKKDLILDISSALKIFENYKIQQETKYNKIQQLGNEGKDAITYLVKTPKNQIYAMKTYKIKKNVDIEKEAYLQSLAIKQGISPKIKEVDTVLNFIIMEKMDGHLHEIMKKQDGNLTKSQQINIIDIFKKLDSAKVFHGDANILNYMYLGNKIYIIDFGMSQIIDSSLIKSLGTNTPNMSVMLLGFILKLKELNCPKTSYKYLAPYLSEEYRKKFKI
jgi:tRNA A-37 threonylcarbamoyl transferase component Bud32